MKRPKKRDSGTPGDGSDGSVPLLPPCDGNETNFIKLAEAAVLVLSKNILALNLLQHGVTNKKQLRSVAFP